MVANARLFKPFKFSHANNDADSNNADTALITTP